MSYRGFSHFNCPSGGRLEWSGPSGWAVCVVSTSAGRSRDHAGCNNALGGSAILDRLMPPRSRGPLNDSGGMPFWELPTPALTDRR
jgi:hypothetical protein